MDNNQADSNLTSAKSQQMQNWKKQLLMDPILNSLFDKSLPAQQFISKKVLTLPHSQIASLYSKLSTINHQLMENIQKEVQVKSNIIEKSYHEFLQYKSQIQQEPYNKNQKSDRKQHDYLVYLKTFNKKYEHVQSSLTIWRNISNCIHFQKQIQNFKVNINILKSLMKGYNTSGNEDTINPIKISKMLRDIAQGSQRCKFEGFRFFQAEKVFIITTKGVVHSIGCKMLPKLLQQYLLLQSSLDSSSQAQKREQILKGIQEWLLAFCNIGTIKQFVVNYGKSMLQDLAQNIKRYIKNDLINLNSNLEGVLYIFIVESCKALVLLEQRLVTLRKLELTNVPNLFVKFWQKLCEFMRQTILWIKKDQQLRNIPKNRDQTLVWKYPLLYASFSKICTNIEIYLLQNTLYNSYHFGKNKQKLMIYCLTDLGIAYHTEKQRYFLEIGNLIGKIKSRQKNRRQFEMEKAQVDHDRELTNQIILYMSNLELLFSEASKCPQVYSTLMDSLCNRLAIISVEIRQQKQANNSDKQTQHEQNIRMLNKIKQVIKQILVKRFGDKVGVSQKQLESFKLEAF